jgi:hypothetical protein
MKSPREKKRGGGGGARLLIGAGAGKKWAGIEAGAKISPATVSSEERNRWRG